MALPPHAGHVDEHNMYLTHPGYNGDYRTFSSEAVRTPIEQPLVMAVVTQGSGMRSEWSSEIAAGPDVVYQYAGRT